jgi:hypothetical protein
MTYDPEKLRLELQSLNLTRDGDEDFDPSSDSELPEDLACKHCGRIVLLGPPCCYNNLRDLFIKSQAEINWLRKIQSRQTKKIQELNIKILTNNHILMIIMIVVVGCLFGWILGNI